MRVLSFVLFVAITTTADARTVDRIAAVVGGQIIMLSEVREHAAPYVHVVDRQETETIAKARAEAKVLHDVCDRMVNETLVAEEAERLHINVTPDEVQHALESVATSNNLTPAALMTAASEQGFDERTYRDVLRTELIEGKVLQLRSSEGVKIEDAAKALHAELRSKTYIEVRLE